MSGDLGTRPLAIVVVSFGSSDLLSRNLIASLATSDAQITVVVDNYSDASERDRVVGLTRDQGWILVAMEENVGFGAGVNAGAAAAIDAGAQDLLIVNPDAVLSPGCTSGLRDAVDGDPTVVCSPRIVTSTGRSWFEGADLYLRDGRTRGRAKRNASADTNVWEWLSGACLWVSVEMWRATGGFDATYFLYWEDVDFSRRVVLAGGSLRVAPNALAIHDEGGTHRTRRYSSRSMSETYYYFNIRNRMLFAARQLDAESIKRWKRNINSSAAEVILRGGKPQLLHSLGPWRAYLRGTRDARRLAKKALAAKRNERPG